MVWRPGRSRGNGKNCPVERKTVLRLKVKKFVEVSMKTSDKTLTWGIVIALNLAALGYFVRALEWIFR